MSNAQLILIDKRNQPIKEYIVAVASSDGLNIKGINVIASPAKGEKALLKATLQIPPLEKLDFIFKSDTTPDTIFLPKSETVSSFSGSIPRTTIPETLSPLISIT